jgi:hypothetical protein
MTTTKSTTRTLTVSSLYREWGEPHRKNQCTVPERQAEWKMACSAWNRARPENSFVTNGARDGADHTHRNPSN